MKIRFEWDPIVAAINRTKHGVSFESAARVFADPLYLSLQDRHEAGEDRWLTFGMVDGSLVAAVAHTVRERDDGDVIRIISARREPRTSGNAMNKIVKQVRGKTAARKNTDIDTSDIPEVTDWSGAVRGRFLKPGAVLQLPVYLEADVLQFLQQRAGKQKIETSKLANELLRRDIELIRVAEG